MFGGTPRCERCGGAVYHAEQVMGPARKIYHKLCLKCEHCAKRLDPGGLVQHDNKPYCSRCHTQLFGTRDLRHANHLPTKPREKEPSPEVVVPPPLPTRITPRAVPPPQDYYTPPDLSATSTVPESPVRSSTGASHSPSTPTSPNAGNGMPATISVPLSPLARSTASNSSDTQRPNFRADRPIPAGLPASVAQSGLSDRGLLRRTDSPRSKVGTRPVVDDRCSGCEKRVYAAEQVMAIGQKWHRGCLRCTSCRSSLDPARVSDRNGQPWCKNCYAREFGPVGIAGKR